MGGFSNQLSDPSYPYQGGVGIEFITNFAISTADVGTLLLERQTRIDESIGRMH